MESLGRASISTADPSSFDHQGGIVNSVFQMGDDDPLDFSLELLDDPSGKIMSKGTGRFGPFHLRIQSIGLAGPDPDQRNALLLRVSKKDDGLHTSGIHNQAVDFDLEEVLGSHRDRRKIPGPAHTFEVRPIETARQIPAITEIPLSPFSLHIVPHHPELRGLKSPSPPSCLKLQSQIFKSPLSRIALPSSSMVAPHINKS